ncbi:MAG: hypothetical protein JWM31_901 [Solirubrobacterales bacterium]|nr:hypothetical protein [Solirubrobacterales bacterium]
MSRCPCSLTHAANALHGRGTRFASAGGRAGERAGGPAGPGGMAKASASEQRESAVEIVATFLG